MRSVLAVSPEWGHDVCFVLSSRWSVKGPWFVFFWAPLAGWPRWDFLDNKTAEKKKIS